MKPDALFEALTRRGHAVRRRYGYRGSLDSVDLAQEAIARVVARTDDRPALDADPDRLLHHATRQVRFVLLDRFRAAGGRAPDARARATLDPNLAAEPEDLEAREQLRWIEDELAALQRGDVRAPFRDPAPKVVAFNLRRQGLTDAAISAQLGVPKPTVNLWIQAVTAHLVVRARKAGMAT